MKRLMYSFVGVMLFLNAVPLISSESKIDIQKVQKLKLEIEKIETSITEFKKTCQCRDLLMVVGRSKMGKSSLGNFLTGKKLIVKADPQLKHSFIVETEGQCYPGMNISHRAASETAAPVFWFDDVNNIVVADCPGFFDTAELGDIRNFFVLKKLMEGFENIKFMLVTSCSNLEEQGATFVQDLHSLATLLGVTDVNKAIRFAPSFFLVSSKTPLLYASEHVANIIKVKIYDDLVAGKGHVEENTPKAKLLKACCEATKIVVFPKHEDCVGDLLTEEQTVKIRESIKACRDAANFMVERPDPSMPKNMIEISCLLGLLKKGLG